MAVRPFVKASVAFAAAGMIAVTPALAPPLKPHDVQIAMETEAQVKLAASLTDLINVYFGVDPYNGVTSVDTDNPGTFGATGVLYQILAEQSGKNPLVDLYFTGGVTPIIQALLTANPNDVIGNALINTFFNDGAAGVALLVLGTLLQDPSQQQFLSDFFTGGATQVAYRQLGGDFTNPATTSTPGLSTFFNINNQYGDVTPAGVNTGVSSNPALFGVSGLTYTSLLGATADPGQRQFINDFYNGGLTQVAQTQLLSRTGDPGQRQVINDFFSGGATQVVRTQLLSRTAEGSPQADLINEFFDNGISGVVRYLLAGPAPEEPEPEDPDDEEGGEGDRVALTAYSRLAAVDTEPETSAPEAGETVVPKVEKPAAPLASPTEPKIETKIETKAEAPKVEVPEAAPVAVEVDSPEVEAPAAPEVVTPKPAAEPVVVKAPEPVAAPEPAPTKPTSSTKVKDEAEDEEADTLKSGNKFEPEIIIPGGGGGGKPGEGTWGIFGDIAQAVVNGIANAGKPAAGDTSPGGGADTGGAGGATGDRAGQ